MDGNHRPIRMCIGCRQRRDPVRMVRLHRTAEGHVGVAARPPVGRGAYLCPEATCFERAWKRGAVSRALRIRSAPPPLGEIAARAALALDARLTRLAAREGRVEERAVASAVLAALESWCPGVDPEAQAVDATSGVGKVTLRAPETPETVDSKGGPANAHG